jgi:hypothetical protein
MPKNDTIYVFDASTFMHFQRTQPPDIYPGLWEGLACLVKEGRLITSKLVLEEARRGDDTLPQWIANHERMLKEKTQVQTLKVGEILRDFPNLINSSSEHEQADPYVIALAFGEDNLTRFYEYAVVTQESFRKENKIPFVCSRLSVKCIDALEFLRREGWIFQLKHRNNEEKNH